MSESAMTSGKKWKTEKSSQIRKYAVKHSNNWGRELAWWEKPLWEA